MDNLGTAKEAHTVKKNRLTRLLTTIASIKMFNDSLRHYWRGGDGWLKEEIQKAETWKGIEPAVRMHVE